VKFKNIKGCRYAVLRITEPFSDPFELIPNGWRKLVDWINSNGFKNSICDDRYWLEEIISENNATYMDLFFPIS
jgi:AraC family transcriptional regulator